ncbi:MAG: CbiX/SirB N-terminal domain-containing protein [Synechococcaceae cyanobacterium]|nr:CbiX/SirB N-terminal domain-containing protein [Synechococcaceae cyanobacterium]
MVKFLVEAPPVELPSPGPLLPPLAEEGSERRWRQLQRLRSGGTEIEPWLEALTAGREPGRSDLLAALFGRLDQPAVERLLAGPLCDDPRALLSAGQQELPALAGREEVRQAWLAPLLARHDDLERALQAAPPAAGPGATAGRATPQPRPQPAWSPSQRTSPPEAPRQEPAAAGPDPARPPLLRASEPEGSARPLPARGTAWALQEEELWPWLILLGQFRDPRVAERLRRGLARIRPPGTAPGPGDGQGGEDPGGRECREQALQALLPLLGLQRQPEDGELLLLLACRPGPLAVRQAALEGVALGLSAWPRRPLISALKHLAADLSPLLAATAVDLLARLPEATGALRQLSRQALDPQVSQRLRRRLPASALLLLVHGRQGGEIPPALQELAQELERRRGAAVRLQALTGEAPPLEASWCRALHRSRRLTLVPLLLLAGSHVRLDCPRVALQWRQRLAGSGTEAELHRLPFLGAWPAWQRLLERELSRRAEGRPLTWLHHPLQGELASRHLQLLERRLAGQRLETAFQATPEFWPLPGDDRLLLPLTLASNRLSETLDRLPLPRSQQLLPPLLEQEPLREGLLELLERLP